MAIKNFKEFKDQFLKWSIDEVEPLQQNNYHVCPYATNARKRNSIHFIDGRGNFLKQIETFDSSNEMGVVWLGDNINVQKLTDKLKTVAVNNPHLIYLLSTPSTSYIKQNFTNTVVIHRRSDYFRKQRNLYESGYYNQYPEYVGIRQKVETAYGELYPIKKSKNQVIGTENQFKIYNQFFNNPGTLLDIGGGSGNLLHYNNPNITGYSCIEVSKKAVTMGKIMYPDAKFFHYNKLNYLYNPDGAPDADFPEMEQHDFVFINSVFTSTDFTDLLYLLSKSLKIAKKRIVFSVFSNTNLQLLDAFYNKFCEREINKPQRYPNKTVDIRRWSNLDNHIFYLVDNDREIFDITTVQLPTRCSSFMTFYNIPWLQNTLEEYFKIDITVQNPCTSDNNFAVFNIER